MAVRRLAVAGVGADHARRGVGRLPVPPRGAARRAASHHDDGHPGVVGHAGRLPLVDGRVRERAVPAFRRPGVLRSRRRGHGVPAGRSLRRGAGEARVRGGAALAAESGRQGRRGAARRRRSAGARFATAGRRRGRGAAGGAGGRRRRDRRRHNGFGHLGDDRRTGAHRRDGRRHRGRWLAEHLRPAAGARHQGRRRHPTGPDGHAGQRRPEQQGPGPADRRPGRRNLRAGGTADLRGDDGRLAAGRTAVRRRRSPLLSRC